MVFYQNNCVVYFYDAGLKQFMGEKSIFTYKVSEGKVNDDRMDLWHQEQETECSYLELLG